MSKLIDQMREAEEPRPAGEPRARRPRDIEAAIDEVAELRGRVESERSAETALLGATRARETGERAARSAAQARRAAGQGREPERAQRHRGWRWLAAALLVVIAAGAGLYEVMRVPQTAVRAIAVDGPLVLRLDPNVAAIPARD